jgi:hypothetical protein
MWPTQRFSTLGLGRVRRRIAINVARLPELLGRAERD